MNNNEIVAAQISELKDGDMKEVTAGETKIILARVKNNFYAVGALCPHYSAPLFKGALCGTTLYCPWHHSGFDVTTGKLCEPPAFDDLPRYKVRVEGEQIFIQLPEQKTETTVITKSDDTRTFIIIGGGAAGCMAAQTLRNNGFGGRIVMITKEADLPYDRPALSKDYLSGEENEEYLPLRADDFYTKNIIEVERTKEVIDVNFETKTIFFTDGNSMQYNKLLIATGGEPAVLNTAGADKKNVFTLRSFADTEKIIAAASNAKRAVIVGASFIGMETAASLTTRGIAVTVIAREKIPFEKVLGAEIGSMFRKLHEEKGIAFRFEAAIERIEGEETVKAVVLNNGERIETDFILAGIGVHPTTGFLQGIQLDERDKSVLVDEQLNATGDVFAAGDIAKFPDVKTGKHIRIEHWRIALQHGRTAALNMLGKAEKVSDYVPFFWTNQFNKRLSYIGHAEEWDEIVVDGDVAAQKFLAFYVKDGIVLAAASMKRDTESDIIEHNMRGGKKLTVEELKRMYSPA